MKFQYEFTLNSWLSKKGSNKHENRDSCSVYLNHDVVFAILVDATDHGLNGIEFSSDWKNHLINLVKKQGNLSPAHIRMGIFNAHCMLRNKGYIHEKAAYAILVLDKKAGVGWTLNCGDCRVGGVNRNGDVLWLTPVHSAANAFGEEFTIKHAQSIERNSLTKCLRIRHFDEPAVSQFELDNYEMWCMATDGFWVDHVLLGEDITTLKDDASVLTLALSVGDINLQTDCANFEYINNTSAE